MIKRTPFARRGSRGLTLIEICISAAILVILLGAAAVAMNSGFANWETSSAAADLEARADRLAEKIASLVGPCGLATIVPDPVPPLGASSITFRRSTNFTAGSMVWSNQMRIQWLADPTDAADGVDNNSNGVIDEGMVVAIYDVGLGTQRTVVLGRGVARFLEGETGANATDDNANGLVDEQGLSFSRAGRLLTIRLTIVKRQRGGGIVQRTVEVPLALRN